ncbi:MAG: TerC/Alx family metal homeostasis membrane protein [Crocinitomicaceae bacterium]|nr:TerC/Alx family metal homeostasis membrane protein [Crocinitomicaceae bacterium]MBK8926892.1 TerC/Alx family metal homeostasis membrane protein [Crocinitomicaceae bacterium]
MVWVLLIALVLGLLLFDLFVLNKKGEHVSNRKAAIETVFWVSIAIIFSGVLYWLYDAQIMQHQHTKGPLHAWYNYITGYLIELSLSVDNLFVIAMIFRSFKIKQDSQHKALFWGIIGAIVLRGVTIILGVKLIENFEWMTWIFGAFLLYTAFKMLKPENEEEEEEKKGVSRLHRIFKISTKSDGDKFWIIEDGVKMATPLFAALIMIELTDLLFALDSIPAIISITEDPFIVFSSNIFAILGLRSMYFFLANMLKKFRFLKYSVFAILLFVALKLLLIQIEFFHFMEWMSLPFIAVSLITGIIVSLLKAEKNSEHAE